jgi:hypothetical protein
MDKQYFDSIRTIYEGADENGVRNGFGKLYSNSIRFENGKMEITSRKLIYQGNWKNNVIDGYGIAYSPISGEVVYVGEWKEGERHGFGRLFWDMDGTYEEAIYENGKPTGNTTRRFLPFEPFSYNDSWVNEHRTLSEEKYFCIDGSWYKGEWYEGQPHGFGIYVCANGAKYIGEWQNGQANGKGTYYYPNSTIEYTGQIQNFKYHGYGVYFAEDGSYREGDWVNDMATGFGLYYKPFRKYNPDSLDPGKYEWIPATWYVGEFLNDMPHGLGKIFRIIPNRNEPIEDLDKQSEAESYLTVKKLNQIINWRTNNRFLWYEGDIKEGDLCGTGTFYDSEGNPRFVGQVIGSIFPTGLITGVGTASKEEWSDDNPDDPYYQSAWVSQDWKGIVKLGHGNFLTQTGKVWFEGTMERTIDSATLVRSV